MTARYAVYFSPARHSPWWTFGAHWLGRDEFADATLQQPIPGQVELADLSSITAEPRRYGFHATLKAPFHLTGGHTFDDLAVRMQALAKTLKPVDLGPFRAILLGNFVALVPVSRPAPLAALAEACVLGLDDLRAPLSEADLARRLAAPLNAREQELLRQYGYPYVLECFRLHFSMSGPLTPDLARCAVQELAQPVESLNANSPLLLDRLCLFVEAAPGQPFKRLIDFPLNAY
jgi:putative phosphonate metabolism protein